MKSLKSLNISRTTARMNDPDPYEEYPTDGDDVNLEYLIFKQFTNSLPTIQKIEFYDFPRQKTILAHLTNLSQLTSLCIGQPSTKFDNSHQSRYCFTDSREC